MVQARAVLDRTRSDVAAAAAGVDFASADARHARAMLDLTRIEAPFDGIVVGRNVNIGDLPRPGADGPPLFVVARSDILTIAVNVPEAFATEIDPGDRATVTLQAMKGRVVEGKVTRISWCSTRRPGRSAPRSISPTLARGSVPAFMPMPPSSPRITPTC